MYCTINGFRNIWHNKIINERHFKWLNENNKILYTLQANTVNHCEKFCINISIHSGD